MKFEKKKKNSAFELSACPPPFFISIVFCLYAVLYSWNEYDTVRMKGQTFLLPSTRKVSETHQTYYSTVCAVNVVMY